MISTWIFIGLILAATSISAIGAAFSIFGLMALFSGATIAVGIMAGSLELAKFVLAAYLHQRWKSIHFAMKTYMTMSIVVLSIITSLGIFGFLSSAYQSATKVLEAETIQQNVLNVRRNYLNGEINRLQKSIDEIPVTMISKKLKVQAEFEPQLKDLKKQMSEVEGLATASELKILAVKDKVGPLIYISRSFKMDIDNVVKYMIMILVTVFDPLAICLVIALSEASSTSRQNQSGSSSGFEPSIVRSRKDEEDVA